MGWVSLNQCLKINVFLKMTLAQSQAPLTLGQSKVHPGRTQLGEGVVSK